ncbi:MAG: ABC transporter ATP-binding protein [Pseudomonadota bacterium]
MLTLTKIQKSFHDGDDDLVVLRDIDLTILAGETVALLGDSGSGKSTVLQIAAGLETPDSGEVVIGVRSIAGSSEAELARLRRRDLGFVFQQFNLIPGLTVEENLLFQRRLNKLPDNDEWVDQLLAGLELKPLLHRRVEVLSGGQQQRVAIARALAHRPRLLFADEPTGNLHDALSKQVITLLCEFAKASGASLLLVTHNRDLAAATDRQLLLRDGCLISLPPNAKDLTSAVAASP